RLTRLRARLVDQGAKTSPNRRAPARSSDLYRIPLKDQESAFVRVGGKTHVRHKPLTTGGHADSSLPRGAIKKDALASAAARPADLACDPTACCERQSRAPDPDHARVRGLVLGLNWSHGTVAAGAGVRARIPAGDKNVHARGGEA